MLEALLKKGFTFYLFLSIFEFALNYGSGSILKLFGFVLMGMWIILLLTDGLKLDRYLFALILFFMWMTLSLLWADLGDLSLYYIMSMGNMIALVSMASSLYWKAEDVSDLLIAMQIGALLFSLILIFGGNVYHEKTVRATVILFGREVDPNSIAGLLLPATLISFRDLMKTNKVIFSGLTFFISVVAIVSTGSRGGVLALIAGLICIILQHLFIPKQAKSRTDFKAFVVIIVLFVLFFYYVVPQFDESLISRFKYSSVKIDRGGNRLELWEIGMELFNSRFLTGIGVGGFEEATGKGLHNQFLIVLVEGGIIGFSLFLIAIAKILGKSFSFRIYLVQAILVSTMVVIFFLDAYNTKFFWNGIMLSIIMIKAQKSQLERIPQISGNDAICR